MTLATVTPTGIVDDERFDMITAPMRIGAVRLGARNLPFMSEYYQKVLGLAVLDSGEAVITLGTAGRPLVELVSDAGLAPLNPREAGLFHTAFLLPSRQSLASWLSFAARTRVPLQGAADHLVSEAIYLADPEGNGIEIYIDRPPSTWCDGNGVLRMASDPLDIDGLMAATGGHSWTGFPEDGCIGHLHLQVGDTTIAERFYRDVLGFDVTLLYPGASFFGSGGYHHQIAGNIWKSRGAGRRPDNMVGLDAFEILVQGPEERNRIASRAAETGAAVEKNDGSLVLRDPWGTRIVVRS